AEETRTGIINGVKPRDHRIFVKKLKSCAAPDKNPSTMKETCAQSPTHNQEVSAIDIWKRENKSGLDSVMLLCISTMLQGRAYSQE
ncbi:mCG145773, partial [Mus musculus]